MKKEKLLHFVDLSMIGGKQFVAINLITSKNYTNKYNQEVINTEKKNISKYYKKELIKNNIKYIDIKNTNSIFTIKKYIFLIKHIIKYRPKYLLLWSVLPNLPLAFIANLIRTKLIFWDHSVLKHKKPSFIFRSGLNRCDLIICNSESSKKLLNDIWFVKGGVICVNPIREDLIPKKTPNKILKSEKLILGFAGRLVPLKGVALIIKAAKILIAKDYNIYLMIAGKKNEEYKFLKKFTRVEKIENYVSFLGEVTDMKKFYEKVDIFVCPSISESFGLVSIEAAANGCPVIGSNIDGLYETIIDGVTGFILNPKMEMREYLKYASNLRGIPRKVYFENIKKFQNPRAVNPADIARVIENIYGNNKIYKKMSKSSYEYAINKYSTEKSLKCIYEYIESI